MLRAAVKLPHHVHSSFERGRRRAGRPLQLRPAQAAGDVRRTLERAIDWCSPLSTSLVLTRVRSESLSRWDL